MCQETKTFACTQINHLELDWCEILEFWSDWKAYILENISADPIEVDPNEISIGLKWVV